MSFGSLFYAGMVAWVVAWRIGYPYELEFMEGAMIQHVERLRQGLPIYVPPTLAFVPLNYTPLYVWLGSLASVALGDTFLAMRVVSALAAVGALVLMWKLVREESGRSAPAWLAVGLFCALFRLGGAWLDIARADSLQLFLVLLVAYVARRVRSRWRVALAAGVLIAIAFLAKQSALVAVAPIAAWLIARDWRRGSLAAGAAAVLVAASIIGLDAASHGWFRYYAFTVPGFHTPDRELLWAFPVKDVLEPLWPLAALGALALARSRTKPTLETSGFLAALAIGFMGVSWLLRRYRGGYDNVLMPGHAAIAILAALAFARLTAGPASTVRPRVERYAACALVALQLVLLWWSPSLQIPTPEDREAGDRMVSRLRARGGRGLVATHPYLARLAGMPSFAHIAPLIDIVRDGHGPIPEQLRKALRDSLRAQEWSIVVLDYRDWLIEEVDAAGYKQVALAFGPTDVFWPVTGMKTRPEWVFIPHARDSTDVRPPP